MGDPRFGGRGGRTPGGLIVPGGMPHVPEIPAEVWDQLGRVLQKGDVVVLPAASAPLFVVMSVAPLTPEQTPPHMPPGLIEVTVQCRLRFLAPRQSPSNELLRVAEAATVAQADQQQTDAPKTTDAPAITSEPSGGDQ